MCFEEVTFAVLEEKPMVPDVETVRVTHPRYELRKKHLFAALILVLVLVGIGVALMLTLGSTALYPVKVNGKYGYINKSAKVVIRPQFDQAEQFSEGYAAVEMGNSWGYIDRNGKLVIPPTYH